MKDFVSKITFGFLMAQLVPGMVVTMAVTCLGTGNCPVMRECVQIMLVRIQAQWFTSSFRAVAFLFLSCAVGMLIHALNWTVLAWVENKRGPDDARPVREARYHTARCWKQLLGGPAIMVYELLSLLKAPTLTHLTMEENVKFLDRDREWQFHFLQEFYLHFGQFYAHTAYALLLTTALGIVSSFREPSVQSIALVVVAYFATSISFLFGRVQLSSLFRAETDLTKATEDSGIAGKRGTPRRPAHQRSGD
jgi:hypothetical protein